MSDFSCSEFSLFLLLMLLWLGWSFGSAAKSATDAAGKLVQNETAREIGKSLFSDWLKSLFK